ncbi:MAG: cytochrome ubiquinol oxidase subunit I [Bacteroidales bacterium]|nr:cytochrome ubiquinol oxidase subunit I [Bacteroidales bacterium]MDD3664196.1 cytochrome ubiquinol oxidase subunit I [Bacteroidales bacterium]
MIGFDTSLIEWSRAQFALTAMFHWLFVPLTLGITFLIAIMETLYVRTGNPEWKRITKFWMTIFGINFAIGVATGIILEFEFGTNWSNYSWFVGDIFGAPLAVEGIMAFFMESTFIAIMFFGWNKVSKGFHLTSTWLTAIGANLSALWILVANAWMQNPVGMQFNPDTARNEMVSFWEVLFSPTAINKFLHTVTSSYMLAAIVVIGISSWFLMKKRDILFAKRSIVVASAFGLLFAVITITTGDSSAREMAKVQPVKFAAMENHYHGQAFAPLVAFGAMTPDADTAKKQNFIFKFEIPSMLSYMAFASPSAYVPGIYDFTYGNQEHGIPSFTERMEKGKLAIQSLASYKEAQKNGNDSLAQATLSVFRDNYQHFGYGYANAPEDFIPPVKLTFYSFRIMVFLGGFFLLLFIYFFWMGIKNKLEGKRWLYITAIFSIPLVYLTSQAGWIVAEVGRQPWVIQDLMPTMAAVSKIEASSVQITFWLFAITFTALLIAELKIMFGQIRKGPQNEGGH